MRLTREQLDAMLEAPELWVPSGHSGQLHEDPERPYSPEQQKADSKAMRNSWATPGWLIEVLERLLGGHFDTDPFFNPYGQIGHHLRDFGHGIHVATGRDLSDPEDDGLTCTLGHRSLVNGPFSKPGPWVERFTNEGQRWGHSCAIVVPNSPGVSWFDDHIWRACGLLFLKRTRFDPPPGITASSPSGSTVVALHGIARESKWVKTPFGRVPLIIPPR